MKIRQAHIRLKTAFLGLVFVVALGLKTAHLLLLHHAHHPVLVCAADHKRQGAHLHDERYNPDDCSICAYLFAIPELVPVSAALRPPQPAAFDCRSAQPAAPGPRSPEASRPRGPPVL